MLTLIALLTFCPGYTVRGMIYEVCPNALYVSAAYDTPSKGVRYRVSLDAWTRSQADLTMGDDERLGA